MLPQITLPAFLATALAFTITQANPIHENSDLITRDNKYNLKCSNAPNIVAGNLVNLDDVELETSLSPSGSSQQWLKYLYCTPGTKTYIFFNFGELHPAPNSGTAIPGSRNVYSAFDQAATAVEPQLANDGPIANGNFTTQAPDTNIEISVHSHVGTMTYGILKSAFLGLRDVSANYNPENWPMLFQINDGQWGEVGLGYAGYKNSVGQCIYLENENGNFPCSSALNGHVDNFD